MGDWTEGALCAQTTPPRGSAPTAPSATDPELFFPAKGQWSTVNTAKRICADCPVRNECLTTALADPSLDGVWGGLTYMERRALRTGAA